VQEIYLVLQVLMPKGAYNGQNETKEVNTKIPASASNTMPKVPETEPVKYKAAMMMAITTRTARSTLPMFFFIWLVLEVGVNDTQI
jgi:hypothetical protein